LEAREMANTKKVTIKEVAKAANVSVATVSYVINGVQNMVSEETKQKVNKVIEELGYVPNITARSLVKQESRLIGIVLPAEENLKYMVLRENPFYLEFISGVEYRALEQGYNTLLVGVGDVKHCRDILNSRNYAGFITFDFIDKEVYALLEQSNVPVVVIEDKYSGKTDTSISYLNSDDFRGGYLAAEHLIKKGHKKICVYTIMTSTHVAQERIKGFKKACEDYNINLNEGFLLQVDSLDIIIDKILQGEYTAIFCVGDILAMYLMKALMKRGIRIPEDMSIIGYDNIASCQFLMPALTTINQQIFNKGAKAVDIILHNISRTNDKINEYIMPVELIERESVQEISKE
jgi:LacI family transcriptional regulator